MLRWLTNRAFNDTPTHTPSNLSNRRAVAAKEDEELDFTPGMNETGIKVKEISFNEFLLYARNYESAK